jgi:AraC-like DNA-binding protein
MEITQGSPALVGANWYQFQPNERIKHEHVASVSFVWVVQGSGVISSGGKTYYLKQNSLLRLPWLHQIEYVPDENSPFHLGTIHLLPWHSQHIPIEPRVAFMPSDPLLVAPYRRGTDELIEAQISEEQSISARNIIALATFGIERFLTNRTDEPSLRSLGTLLFEESSRWSRSVDERKEFPVALEAMMEKILSRLDVNFSVAEIAKAGDCSTATARRLFLKYTGQSVLAWSRRRRMLEAATLLKTSGQRVNEIARQLGYSDSLYFSRTFSKFHGVSPTAYASRQLKP